MPTKKTIYRKTNGFTYLAISKWCNGGKPVYADKNGLKKPGPKIVSKAELNCIWMTNQPMKVIIP
jgi:hypothetical protein